MTRMALKAQERFLDLEHVSEHGPVRRMARRALIGDIGMLPGKRANELPMAIDTKSLLVQCHKAAGSLAPMGFVAVGAKHLALWNGMPVNKGKCRPDAIVATQTLLVDLLILQLLLRAFV
jgi:hypothetical protein